MKYYYFIKEKSTGKFAILSSINAIVNNFHRLASKSCTIGNRFRLLDKEKKDTVLNEWGYLIFRTKEIKK